MRPSPFEEILSTLTRQRGVVGCLVVGENDGLIVDASVQVGVHEFAIAALVAALFRKARVSAQSAGLGDVTFLRLEAERGHLCAAGRDELVLITVAEPRANVGLIRSAMLRSVEALV